MATQKHAFPAVQRDNNNRLYLMDNKSMCNNKPSSAFSLRKTGKDTALSTAMPLANRFRWRV
jgi:hypothetical protein